MTYRLKGLIAYAASMLALAALQMVSSSGAMDLLSANNQDLLYSMLSQAFCMGAVPLAVLFALRKGEPVAVTFGAMRYRAPKSGKVWLIAVAVGLLMLPFTMVFVGLTNFLLGMVGFTRSFPVGTVYDGVGTLVRALILTAVMPAIFEELTHRGLLMSALEDRGSEAEAVVFSAMFFALMHANPVQIVYAFFGGIVMGYLAIKSGSVFPSMIVHFSNNAVSVLLDYCRQRGNVVGRWYDGLFDAASGNLLGFGLLMIIFVAAVLAVIKLLQMLPKITGEKAPTQEVKIFGLLTADKYRPDGKPTLYDNLPFYAIAVMQAYFTAFLLVWGIIR